MKAPIRITRLLPNAFAMLTRAFVLFVLVGISSASTAQAHQGDAFSPVAAQASGIASLNECCHAADQSAQHTACALSICCSLSVLAEVGAHDVPLATASMRPLIGPMGFASLSCPPILHPPIAI
ncbi:hypothetical protein [Alkalilacustris brevis]|uniref:hypothetical protein n=1 Tax=Alkalilacustris brevis TaxID=2026338 RepID=UPI0012D2CD8F|nr:hypothetical protein [Alkalilacustris brevis]